ncbi:unnamed protein product [Didymodactylos carnosus]|uniref:DED domain-containing protein n=1 Tax=Didymodactylos carnosus TaxID=1234261 RepID=A0A814LGW2_9BILA|nr:unnamed protein product [Didymodactylos carnosus]CAF3833454.1 unnamed protein product [Didymodactylos carnosus]
MSKPCASDEATSDDLSFRFREILIKILDHLSQAECEKLSFLLGDDVERRIRDDRTTGGTLKVFQQLFDRGKISEEDFTYLIKAFDAIKCRKAAKSLRDHQRLIVEQQYFSSQSENATISSLISTSPTGNTAATTTSNEKTASTFSTTLLKNLTGDWEDDKSNGYFQLWKDPAKKQSSVAREL